MKTVFDPAVRADLIKRVESLQTAHNALWGKMNLHQMVRHCVLCNDMCLEKLKIKRAFIGRLIGPLVLKSVLKDERPFRKHSPTSTSLIVAQESADLEAQKKELIGSIEEFSTYTGHGFVHPFFGRMTKEQMGQLAYKHTDHHLRQFGV